MFSSIERLKFNIFFFFNKRLKTIFTNKLQYANEGSNNFTAFNEPKCEKKKIEKESTNYFHEQYLETFISQTR